MDGPQPSDAGGGALPRLEKLLDEAHRLVDFLHARVASQEGDDTTTSGEPSGLTGKSLTHTLRVMLARALDDPKSLAAQYAGFAEDALAALQGRIDFEPSPGDRRFKDELWRTSPLLRGLLQIYLAWQRRLVAWADSQPLSADERKRVQFVLDQLVAALAPSNLPLNPSALKRAEATEGASVVQGLRQWADDVLHHRAMPRQIEPGTYTLGRDLAVTPGAVVLRNELLELIQYDALAPTVHRRPLLMIPPQINKYYIFDLKPENSLFRYLIGEGIQVFTLSWRNPDASMHAWGLDAYVQATLQAIEVMRSITKSATVGLVSACAGGLTAIALMGWLAAERRRTVAHHSLLVTAPLADNGSTLECFASRRALLDAAAWSEARGTMDGEQLARLFAWLRPNDLVWNYWVNNYLMGRSPPALDVLHWDNDSTRLPAALHRDFVEMVDARAFERPKAMRVLSRPIDFRRVKVDGYFVGGREDYLMPWHGVYRAARHFGGRHTFVLSTSGHVQSIVRPPRLGRTEHFARDDGDLPERADDWLAGATRREGSWWPHWAAWLGARSNARVRAPASPGSAAFPPIEPAPGSYVRAG